MLVPTKFEFSYSSDCFPLFVHVFMRARVRMRKYLQRLRLLGLVSCGRLVGAALGCRDLNVFLGKVRSYGKGTVLLTEMREIVGVKVYSQMFERD
jgi:hypothetical protein